MKKTKKLLCLFLAMVILIPNIAIFSNAVEAEQQAEVSEPLLIEVTTDKSSYTAYGIAGITVKVTNTSDEAINNISAEAVFEQLAPVGKDNETFKEVGSLQSNESFEFSYKATVNSSKVKINFFAKIFLWFTRLFNGGYTATSHDIEADIENVTEIKFGKYTVQNVVRVGYGETYGEKVEKAVDNSTYVSTEIEEIKNSEKYKSLSTEEKKKLIENKLNDLLNEGEIKSFNYSETNGLFSFEFSSGWRGGTVIEEKHDENCFSSSSSNININNGNDFYNVRNFSASTLTYSNNTDKWLFIYGADENKSSYNYKHFTQLMNQYKDLGIDITLWDDVNEVTVSSYKNLDNYDLIYIMSHGNYYDTPYICTNEEATEEKKNNYSTELDNNDVEIYDGCFWIKPSFFENSYEDDLQDSLILMSCCKAFGDNSNEDYSFSKSFEKAGAGAVIGYCNSVANTYSNNFFEKIIYYITQNYSIGDAYDNSCDIIGQSEQEFYRNLGQNIAEEHPAYPVLYASNRNEKFIENSLEDKLGGFSAVIKDKSNNKPLEDVLVVICESNDSEKNLLCFFETDSNGSFFAELPNGKYNCLIHKNKYKDVEITFEINNCELVAYLEPIFIEPILTSANASVYGMVKDEKTGNAISGVRVEFIDNSTDNYDTVATATTGADGSFSVELPYGSYSMSFNHDDYEYYGESIDVDFENIELPEPILLTPKNSSGGDDDSGETIDPNRTVIDSGNCGADGDNVKWVLYDDGELVISGTGAMAESTPWDSNSSIKSVKVCNGVTNISNGAFWYCRYITNISIPESVSSIGDEDTFSFSTFNGCESLTSITVDKNNKYYSCDNYGVLFNKDKTKLILYPRKNERISYTIPDSVTRICDGSFEKCMYLENITIGKGVSIFESYAFRDCSSLENVYYKGTLSDWCNIVFGSSAGILYAHDNYEYWLYSNPMSYAKHLYIDEKKLEGQLVIPNNIKEIKNGTFYNCDDITDVVLPNGVTEIGTSSFYCCDGLMNISIPKSVVYIGTSLDEIRGDGLFASCGNLTNISVDADNMYFSSDEYGILFDKEKTKLIKYPAGNTNDSYAIPNTVTQVCAGAFMENSYLTNITMPDSVTIIGDSAFAYCGNITNVTLPSTIQTISDNVFFDCNSLVTVKFPDTVKSIGDGAFGYCNIISINIPEGVKRIEMHCFSNCVNLKSVTIPNTVTEIRPYAFDDCTSLDYVYYGGSKEDWGKITIDSWNRCLTNATIHYNSKI